MTERVAFLMKDILLLTASFYLLKQDVAREALSEGIAKQETSTEAVKAVYSAQ